MPSSACNRPLPAVPDNLGGCRGVLVLHTPAADHEHLALVAVVEDLVAKLYLQYLVALLATVHEVPGRDHAAAAVRSDLRRALL